MSNSQQSQPKLERMSNLLEGSNPLSRYCIIHVSTTCDEHGVYVTKDSAECIEMGWILLDAKSCEEVFIWKQVLKTPWYLLLLAPSRERFSQTCQYTHNPTMQ